MKTRIKHYCILLVLFAIPVFAQELSVKTDRADAIYDVDDEVVFTIYGASEGAINYCVSNDRKEILKKETIKCNGDDITVTGTLDRPGFLMCSVTFTPSTEDEQQQAAIGAGFEPEKIKPAQNHMPDDFDAFWQQKKKELAAVPMNPVLTPEPNEEGILIYDVQLDCVMDKPVSGYFAKPIDAEKGSCPAIVFYHGAGVYSSFKERIIEYCKEGFIALEINAHGLPNGRPKEYYENLYKTTLNKYWLSGREDRETSYFTGMYLRAYRALEFLKAQPEWDGKNLITWGASQGGAQSIAAAGLDPDVTFVFASVPAMCDHGGAICGWPRMVPVEENGSYNQTILNASKYVDDVNFASKTHAAAFFTVGFVDQVCRPSSVYAAYNVFAGPKEMLNVPSMGHALLAEHQQMAKERILKYVK